MSLFMHEYAQEGFSSHTKWTDKELAVLIDTKTYSGEFENCIGWDSAYTSASLACKKIFNYKKYWLEDNFNLVLDKIKTKAGIIIISTFDNYYKLFDKIKLYCDELENLPILIVLEKFHKNYDGTMGGLYDINLDYKSNENLMFDNIRDKKITNQISKLDSKYVINKQNVRYEYLDNSIDYNQYKTHSIGLSNMKIFNKDVLFGKKFLIKMEKKQKISTISDIDKLEKNLLNLEELVKQFVDCNLHIDNWNHLNRLRLIYFSLKNFGYSNTLSKTGWLCVYWNKNTTKLSHLWNYTLIKFWIDEIHALMVKNAGMNFAEIYNKYTYLSDENLLQVI